jgi:transposase, IS30 family
MSLVERHPRYVMLVKIANKDTESVVSALIKQSQRLPSELYRSLTWDRGKELADHQRLTLATEVEVYFCDPRSPKRKHQQIAPPISSAWHRSVPT